MNNNVEALNYFKKSLNSKKRNIIFNSSGVYINIANVYQDMKQYEESLKYFRKVLEEQKKHLGIKHILTLETFYFIGQVYQDMGNIALAKKYLNFSKNNLIKKLDENDFRLQKIYTALGYLYLSDQNYLESFTYLNKSFKIYQNEKEKNFTILDDIQKNNYKILYKDIIITLIKAGFYTQKKIKTLNHWFNYKGTLFEYQNLLVMIENKVENKNTKEKINNLRQLTKQLANSKKINFHNINKIDKNKIQFIEEQISQIHIHLSEKNKVFQEILGLKNITYQNISTHLKNSELYIDFIKTDENYYLFTLNKNNKINFIRINGKDSKTVDLYIKELKTNNQKMVQAIKNVGKSDDSQDNT